MECVELAPAVGCVARFESGSKLHALHTLRAVWFRSCRPGDRGALPPLLLRHYYLCGELNIGFSSFTIDAGAISRTWLAGTNAWRPTASLKTYRPCSRRGLLAVVIRLPLSNVIT